MPQNFRNADESIAANHRSSSCSRSPLGLGAAYPCTDSILSGRRDHKHGRDPILPYEKPAGYFPTPPQILILFTAPGGLGYCPGPGTPPWADAYSDSMRGRGGRVHPAKAWTATVFRKSATTASRKPGNPYMRFNIRLPRGPTSVYWNSLRDCTVSEVIK